MALTLDAQMSWKLIRRFYCEPQMCWLNSLKIVYLKKGLVYVEGHVASAHVFGFVFEHGWIETEDGTRMYEVTPNILRDADAGKMDASRYFPGLRWKHEDIVRLWDEHGEKLMLPLFGSLLHYRSKEYSESSDAANEFFMPGYTEWRRQNAPRPWERAEA